MCALRWPFGLFWIRLRCWLFLCYLLPQLVSLVKIATFFLLSQTHKREFLRRQRLKIHTLRCLILLVRKVRQITRQRVTHGVLTKLLLLHWLSHPHKITQPRNHTLLALQKLHLPPQLLSLSPVVNPLVVYDLHNLLQLRIFISQVILISPKNLDVLHHSHWLSLRMIKLWADLPDLYIRLTQLVL